MSARPRAPATEIVIDAPARVHFGMLDLAGALGRRFGGIGAGVHPPGLGLSASLARDVVVTFGGDAEASPDAVDDARAVAARAARRLLDHHGVTDGLQVTLHRLLPAHHGLGSGTQLALAAARAAAELYDLPRDATALSAILGRARRSAVGTYVFEHGGFVVEGGRRVDLDRPAPLLARLAIPPDWRCVLALPDGQPGLSGSAEAAAFAALPRPPEHEVERVAHLVLMALLPALADGEFREFGAALAEIQRINGRWFSAAQGGTYAPGASAYLIDVLTEWGATGVGQSSWGPAVYALAPDPDASGALARRLSSSVPSARVFDATFCADGAQVRVRR
jgi:beta-ribofuranosylaminobenzene 5'-phosphate synthase